MADKVSGLMWPCRTCGASVTAELWSCPNCGYKRTEFDLARLVTPGDTGSYVATRLTQPSFSELSVKTRSVGKRVIASFAAGSAIVLLLLFLAYSKGC